MSVFASTATLVAPRGLWDILDAFRSAGIERVELGHADLDGADRLVARLRAAGFTYLVHNYFPPPRRPFVLNLASPDPGIASRSLAFVLEALDFAAEVGSPLYAVHSGFITDPIGFDGTSFVLPPPSSAAEATRAQERFVEALAQAVTLAERLDIMLLIENSVCTEDLRGKLLALDTEKMLEVLAPLASSHFGLLLDTGHLNVTARTLGFDRADFVQAVAPYIRAWHVHENDGFADSHLPVERNGWVHELVSSPAFAGLPVTVEAKFADATALAAHVRWLEDELEGERR